MKYFYKNILNLSYYKSTHKKCGWFRLFGIGLKWKHINNGLTFSERNGYKKYLRIGNWIISYLPYSIVDNKSTNYLLTDFNTERWKGINIESVYTQVEKLNEKINKHGCLFGEFGHPTKFDFSFSNISHSIKNLTFEEDGKVYGDIEFLDNINGNFAKEFINNKSCRFGIRGTWASERYKDGGEIVISSIFTWDIINY